EHQRLVAAAARARRGRGVGVGGGGLHGRQGVPRCARGVVGRSDVPGGEPLLGDPEPKAAAVINFRYHVVSLTAVFLALAIGLVVGTAALNGPLVDDLNDRVNGLSNHNNQLREQVDKLEQEVNSQENFAVEVAPHVLAGQLTDRRVVVVCLPAANKYADSVAEALEMAGAKVTGRVDIQDK